MREYVPLLVTAIALTLCAAAHAGAETPRRNVGIATHRTPPPTAGNSTRDVVPGPGDEAAPPESAVCTPDCPFQNWNGPTTLTLMLPSGCRIQATYYTRTSCQSRQFQFTMLKYLDASCLGIPFQTLHQQLDMAWMSANPEAWPPENEGDCANDWQSVKGSCWGFWNSQGVSSPCPGFACCVTNYSVCIVNGQRVINQGITIVNNAANCEAQNCFPVCRF